MTYLCIAFPLRLPPPPADVWMVSWPWVSLRWGATGIGGAQRAFDWFEATAISSGCLCATVTAGPPPTGGPSSADWAPLTANAWYVSEKSGKVPEVVALASKVGTRIRRCDTGVFVDMREDELADGEAGALGELLRACVFAYSNHVPDLLDDP